VTILSGAPRSIRQLAARTFTALQAATGQRCYTLAAAQQLVHRLLNAAAGRAVPVNFALTQQERGAQFTDVERQRYYDQGCTVVVDVSTASDGQTFLVLLQNKAGTPLKDGAAVPDSAYEPRLTRGFLPRP
jgi:alpha-D-ribose 1-methylphosphonate 5-triphosphate synthase subunit PhnH